ncbi:cytochrome c3 family protein [Rubrivivax sp. A210]|uniref:cytochrome c3 family protein n=1 Tax=Rubrivivax sp. A210 TaxID=2772301 RepID=UPI001F2648B7|nr:cytochrome c3 family protein [Rubrivivax sp. A210]
MAALIVVLACLPAHMADAQRVSDVRGTRHNLSTSGAFATHAATPGGTSEVCVFCHTPHGATQADQGGAAMRAPLWNRRVPAGATYTPYTSSSLDAQYIADGFNNQPGGSSKLCLSCHDGTLAIGSVNVLNGQSNATIQMTGTGPGGVMPAGEGTSTGFTRFLGTDLRNDHPISVTFNAALAARDGELRAVDAQQRWPAGSGSVVGVRSPALKPLMPLEATGNGGVGQVQCASCHDPHIRELDASKGNQKFLRAQRFQEATPTASFNAASDIVCLSCHDKNGSMGIWAFSAHANPSVADETYRDASATLREFPPAQPVWKASCLNCHDTHTVQGARRLTREGTDGALPGGNPLAARQGGNPALENTCYQCHTTGARSALANVTQVPNIESAFGLGIRMPITTAEQGGATETHDISANYNDGSIDCSTATNRCGADGMEPKATLALRHAECTDCHNPHRVIKNRLFNSDPSVPEAAGTHRHDEAAGYTHSNLASGVLRGSWGVEPVYASTSFQVLPNSYTVKRGDPGTNPSTAVTQPYVTREYQVCLKCHSDFGYADNNLYPAGNRPALGRLGGTPAGSNNLTIYTNQAKEFQAPVTHQGEGTKPTSGAGSNYATNNHRGWHPVMGATGRNGAGANAFRSPWSNAVGTQTMYCSDCHGENTAATSVVPPGGENGSPWGPHGSQNNFLLKGLWNNTAGSGTANTLCFKCHDQNTYADRNGGGTTGFFQPSGRGNLHAYHTDKIGRIRCNWCHVAVPHGWKNKALLVNLNDVGEEAGQPAGGNREWRYNASGQAFNQEPYYMNAKLKVRTFATSGNWTDTNCGSNNSALTFGTNGNETINGKDWMKNVCSNPP